MHLWFSALATRTTWSVIMHTYAYMVFSLMAGGYAIRIFSLLQAWLNMWATKPKRVATVVLHGSYSSFWRIWQMFETHLNQWHDKTAKFSQCLVLCFIIGIYFWNSAQLQGTMFAEALRLPRLHRTSGSSLYVIDDPCWFTSCLSFHCSALVYGANKSHFLSLLCGLLAEVFWLAEASRKLLLLA